MGGRIIGSGVLCTVILMAFLVGEAAAQVPDTPTPPKPKKKTIECPGGLTSWGSFTGKGYGMSREMAVAHAELQALAESKTFWQEGWKCDSICIMDVELTVFQDGDCYCVQNPFTQIWTCDCNNVFKADVCSCLVPPEQKIPEPRHAMSLPRAEIEFNTLSSDGRIRLSIDLSRSTHVDARIYDVRGREVGTLVDEGMPAGRSVSDHQLDLSSGVYFVRVHAGETVEFGRVVILR